MRKNLKYNSRLVTNLLGVAFVVLKIKGDINWSWWYVTLPFWAGFVLIVIISCIILLSKSIKK